MVVIFFTILFEMFFHFVEHKLLTSPVHLGMLRKLYSELMILGFISFIIFMLIQVAHARFAMLFCRRLFLFVRRPVL